MADEMMLVPRTLGEALRLLMQRANLGRDEVARRAGINGSSLSKYTQDEAVPSAAVLRRVANVLAQAMGEDPGRAWEELGSMLDEGVVEILAKRTGAAMAEIWAEFGALMDQENLSTMGAWAEWAEQHLALAAMRTHRYWLLRATVEVAPRPLVMADTKDLRRFLMTLDPAGARDTAQRVIEHFFQWAKETGRIEEDPVSVLTEDKGPSTMPGPGEGPGKN